MGQIKLLQMVKSRLNRGILSNKSSAVHINTHENLGENS